MKVLDLMQRQPAACNPNQTLAEAGRVMAQVGCGGLPVLSDQKKVLGMITDRDICLALAKADRKPSELTVGQVMGREIYTCRQEEDLDAALAVLQEHKVRRLPVVDDEGALIGILTLDALVVTARDTHQRGFTGPTLERIARTLQAICEPPVPMVAG